VLQGFGHRPCLPPGVRCSVELVGRDPAAIFIPNEAQKKGNLGKPNQTLDRCVSPTGFWQYQRSVAQPC
jgi:hypothetical protein